MDVGQIITIGLTAIVVPLIVLLVNHIISKERDRIERFNNASDEFRKVFNQARVDICSDRFLFDTFGQAERINPQRVAYLNFRHHLHGECRKQYDKTWNQYCNHYDRIGRLLNLTRVSRMDLEKDIKCLLEFTEYSLLRNMFFFWQNLWFRLRLNVFGPDKKTKELIDKISNHDIKPLP